MHRLYHYPLSPFSRKVRLVLAEKKIEVELIEERYWEPSSEFLRLNPAGRVPILRINNYTFCESNSICEYLEEKYPDYPLMPNNVEERAEVRRIVNWFDDSFYKEVTLNLLGERIMKKIKGTGYPDSKNVKEGAKRIKFHLDYIADLLDNRRSLERLVNDQGVVVKEFNDDVYAAFKRGSDEVYEEVQTHSALAKKIHESMVNARKIVGDYVQLNDVAYTNKRNAALGA